LHNVLTPSEELDKVIRDSMYSVNSTINDVLYVPVHHKPIQLALHNIPTVCKYVPSELINQLVHLSTLKILPGVMSSMGDILEHVIHICILEAHCFLK
jgi:hypothetical protein